jgi:hypothetical protein
MLIKSKKAQERMIYTITELIATVLIIAVMWGAAYSYGKGEPYEKLYLAKDIAMNLNALHSIEGDFNFIYTPTNLNKYLYRIKNSLVTVAKDNFDDPSRAEYFFTSNQYTTKIDSEFRKPAALTFIKRGNQISIVQDVVQPNKTTIICQESIKKDSNWKQQKKLFIDPLSDINPDYTLKLAESLKARINPENIIIPDKDSNKLQLFSYKNPDILLIIQVSEENIPKITLSYNNINENSILNCLLRKEFQESYNIEPNVIFSDSDQLLNLAENKLALKIEINPSKYPAEKTTNILYNAIKNYYE